MPALIDWSAPSDAAAADRLPMAPAALRVECVDILRLAEHLPAWQDLCARALESNIFLDPAFALPLVQHACRRDKPRFLLVWEENGPVAFGRLLGLFALDLPRHGGLSRLRLHKQTSGATPLVDRDSAGAVIDAALDWLAAHRHGRLAALVVPSVCRDGPFADALRHVCATSSRRVVAIEERSRAVLRRPGDGRVACLDTARRNKTQARKARRLAEIGVRAHTSARTPGEVAAATERFLELEQRSWKGARGTALLSSPALATFTRTMTRLLAADGKCRIDAVEIDGRPIAMGIVLSSGERAYFWKIAFDPAYKTFSPGVQLALDVTQTQLADPTVELTDSCAEPDHPMIDRLWPERVTMVDLMVGLAADRAPRFVALLRVERARCSLRRSAKALYVRMRRFAVGRLPSRLPGN